LQDVRVAAEVTEYLSSTGFVKGLYVLRGESACAGAKLDIERPQSRGRHLYRRPRVAVDFLRPCNHCLPSLAAFLIPLG